MGQHLDRGQSSYRGREAGAGSMTEVQRENSDRRMKLYLILTLTRIKLFHFSLPRGYSPSSM